MEKRYAGCVIFEQINEHGYYEDDDMYTSILKDNGNRLKFKSQEEALEYLLKYAEKKGYDLYKTSTYDTCLHADVITNDYEVERIHIRYWIEDLYEA